MAKDSFENSLSIKVMECYKLHHRKMMESPKKVKLGNVFPEWKQLPSKILLVVIASSVKLDLARGCIERRTWNEGSTGFPGQPSTTT
jgi:hypothetical protein